MNRKYNSSLVKNAKELRKNMTKEERHLWYDFLRNYPVKFTRQKMLCRYIADFYCASAKLVVELDGSQHYSDDGIKRDEDRTEFLNLYGIKVVRIMNSDVMHNFDAVCAFIDKEVRDRMKMTSPQSAVFR